MNDFDYTYVGKRGLTNISGYKMKKHRNLMQKIRGLRNEDMLLSFAFCHCLRVYFFFVSLTLCTHTTMLSFCCRGIWPDTWHYYYTDIKAPRTRPTYLGPRKNKLDVHLPRNSMGFALNQFKSFSASCSLLCLAEPNCRLQSAELQFFIQTKAFF